MFVRDLPAGEGMLFPQKPPRSMSMWMKNTYIELERTGDQVSWTPHRGEAAPSD